MTHLLPFLDNEFKKATTMIIWRIGNDFIEGQWCFYTAYFW